MSGQVIRELSKSNINKLTIELPEESGIYLIHLVSSSNESAVLKVVKL